MIKNIKKCTLIILGSISLTFGIVGIFIPVLPTTPFLLLASFCYLRSSARLYKLLMRQRVIGPYIHNYVTYKAVLKSTKIKALIFLWSTLIISILLVHDVYIRLLLVVIGISVSIHLFTLKTITKYELEQMGGKAQILPVQQHISDEEAMK